MGLPQGAALSLLTRSQGEQWHTAKALAWHILFCTPEVALSFQVGSKWPRWPPFSHREKSFVYFINQQASANLFLGVKQNRLRKNFLKTLIHRCNALNFPEYPSQTASTGVKGVGAAKRKHNHAESDKTLGSGPAVEAGALNPPFKEVTLKQGNSQAEAAEVHNNQVTKPGEP